MTATVAAVVLAAPTLALPADGPTAPKAAFAVVGAALFIAAVVLVRREPGARPPVDAVEPDPVSPSDPGETAREG